MESAPHFLAAEFFGVDWGSISDEKSLVTSEDALSE